MNTQDIADRKPDAYDLAAKCPDCGWAMFEMEGRDPKCVNGSCQRKTRLKKEKEAHV